ncbi:MAG: hypothetical protein HUU23_13345 [Caldilineales bacterium]|nr:hypothetical protein [Caldilineales bacterium]
MLIIQIAWFWHAIIEDAFISFRYAYHWAAGRGLTLNPGEAVEGYSNFLWTLAIGLGMRLGGEPAALARWLGLAAMLALLGVIFWAARRWAGVEAAALALTLAGSSTALAFWATAGLETILYALWTALALGLYLAAAEPAGAVRPGWQAQRYALFLALAALTRPEGLGLALLLILLEARRGGPRPALRAALLCALPYAVFLLWRWQTYGALLPNSLLAKAGLGQALASEPARFFMLSLAYAGNWALKWGLPVWLLLIWPARGHAAARPLLLTIAYTGLVALVGAGDWMPLQRLWLAALPPFIWLAVIGWQRQPRRGLAALLIAILILLQWDLPALRQVSRDTRPLDRWWQTQMQHVRDAAGEEALPMATTVLGRTGYYLRDLPLLDAFGLADSHIAREGAPALRLGRTDWAYTLAQAPAFILINDPQPGLRRRMATAGSYQWLDLPAPPDFAVALFVRQDLAGAAATAFAATLRPADDPAIDVQFADLFSRRQRAALGPLYSFCDPATSLCQPLWHLLKP